MLEKTVWGPSGHEKQALLAGQESEAGNRVGFDSLEQNQRVFEAFSLILPRRPTLSDSLEERIGKAGLGWDGILNAAADMPDGFFS